MEIWYAIISVFTLPLDQIGPLLGRMPVGLLIVVAAIPIVAAIFSKSYGELCGIIVLLGVAIAVLLAPTAAPGITAVAAYFACLALAFEAIQKWRGARIENVELAELREEVASMRDAEQDRKITELNTRYPLRAAPEPAPTIAPK
jgi:hypothetical protein